MSALDDYIERMKKETKDFNEIETIRYVYLDLGKRCYFDTAFAFGNKKNKSRIYSKAFDDEYISECFEENTGICVSIAKILNKVLTELGTKSQINTEIGYIRNAFRHVYNSVVLKDGTYMELDLQYDLDNIQSRTETESFGMDGKGNCIFTRKQLEEMDRKLGYITEDKPRSNDYPYLLKADKDFFDTLEEKVEFVLENIEFEEEMQLGYLERQWHHKRVLHTIFDKKERDKLFFVDCYREQENNQREYFQYIALSNGGDTKLFEYDYDENKYQKISLIDFAKQIKSGLKTNVKIQGLNKILRELDDEVK